MSRRRIKKTIVSNPFLQKQQVPRKKEIVERKKNRRNVTIDELISQTASNRSHSAKFSAIDRNEQNILREFKALGDKIQEHATSYSAMKRLKANLDAQIAINDRMVAKLREIEHRFKQAQIKLRERESELQSIQNYVKQRINAGRKTNVVPQRN